MPVGDDAVGDLDRHRDLVGAVAHVDRHPLGHLGAALEVAVGLLVAPAVVLVDDRLEDPVVEGEHVVAPRLLPPQRDQLGHLLREFGGQVVDLGDVLGHVVELPDVVVPGRVGPQAVVVDRADRVVGHRLPAVVVDRPRPEHLEVLGDDAGRARARPPSPST